tara:strand:- start:980 stop:1213 length:234 start_codon:yes stop_codon:yes gene_type:complete
MQKKDVMKLKVSTMLICATVFLAGCDPTQQSGARFKDVARKPPLTQQKTVDYLVRNDRPMAEWVEEMASACDRYGCL